MPMVWPSPRLSVVSVQVHIKHVGEAGMLFNPAKLRGIAPKIQKLAARERAISLAQAANSSGSLAASPGRAGQGPVQLAEVTKRDSRTDSAEPSPLRRMVSTPPKVREAPRVKIVPGVMETEVPF